MTTTATLQLPNWAAGLTDETITARSAEMVERLNLIATELDSLMLEYLKLAGVADDEARPRSRSRGLCDGPVTLWTS